MDVRRLAFLAALVAASRTMHAQRTAPCASSAALFPGANSVALKTTGVSVGVLDSAALSSLAGRTLSEALAARLPGVSVMRSSGAIGTGSRISVRGPSGVLIPQRPLLYVDGIRVDDEMHSIVLNAGGHAPSRLDDIPLDHVACVHVLRGPAATARYGTDAAGGVILVTTRAPQVATSDALRFGVFMDGGASADHATYPANFGTTGTAPNTQVRSWNPIRGDSPFRMGGLAIVGGDASVSLGRMVAATVRASSALEQGALRNNEQRRFSLGAAATFAPAPTLSLRSRVWLLGSDAQLPLEGGVITSVLANAMLGGSVDDSIRRGYSMLPLAALEQLDVDQRARRVGGSVDATWRPTPWLSVGAVVGREDSRVRDKNDSPHYTLNGSALVTTEVSLATADNRTQRTTAAASATTIFGPDAFRGSTTVALGYATDLRRYETRSTSVLMNDPRLRSESWEGFFPPPAKNGSVTVRQALASNDRRFAEVGVRHDRIDGDLVEFNDATYPFANASWLLSSEPFYPRSAAVSSLRLRAAYGESGDGRPQIAAYRRALFPPITLFAPASVDRFEVERSREIEAGVDLGAAGERTDIGVTWFQKRTSRGLVISAFSTSAGSYTGFSTAATWQTRGIEVSARSHVFDARWIGMEVALSATALRNTFLSFGALSTNEIRARFPVPGYPLRAAWGSSLRYSDADRNGVLSSSEVTLDTGAVYFGSPTPTREIGFAPTITIAKAWAISALVDHRGGFQQLNGTERIRCGNRRVCAARNIPGTPLDEQARALAAVFNDQTPWLEPGDFVRLREVGVRWNAPSSFAQRIGARSVSLTVAGRNVAIWTRYSGLDPEVSAGGQQALQQQELFTSPLVRTFSLRLDVRR